MKIKLNQQLKVFLISLAISIGLFLLGIISADVGVRGNAIILSVFILVSPQLLMRYSKYRAIKEMEDKFPLFLRDMVESVRAGMPFHKALMIVSKLDYGKLSKEVEKAANQVSWGVTFDKVINQFAERVKESKRLYISLKTIRESHLSGGDVVSTLGSIADTAVMLEESEKERKSLLNQYVVLMYSISFLFIGIVAAINKLMVPIFQITTLPGGEFIGITNPCGFGASQQSAAGQSVCSLFLSACAALSIEMESVACYYTSLFFYMSLVEAIFCGLVAGQISENSVIAGVKHSVIMSMIALGAFNILVRIGIMGV